MPRSRSHIARARLATFTPAPTAASTSASRKALPYAPPLTIRVMLRNAEGVKDVGGAGRKPEVRVVCRDAEQDGGIGPPALYGVERGGAGAPPAFDGVASAEPGDAARFRCDRRLAGSCIDPAVDLADHLRCIG